LLAIPTVSIKGYQQEEYTHLAVAAAIASRRADCGLGIAAAAQALGLDFIPLYQERYDLVIPQRYYYDILLEPLISILNDPDFKKTVSSLPGYNTDQMGLEIL
jgi:putative molybdopterin biosynthesis protein